MSQAKREIQTDLIIIEELSDINLEELVCIKCLKKWESEIYSLKNELKTVEILDVIDRC